MDIYTPPLDAMDEALGTAGLDEVLGLPAFAQFDRSTVAALLAEFGRFAAEVVAPTDRLGDRQGLSLDAATGAVSTPDAFKDAYRHYVDAGWATLAFPVEYGGGGLPAVVGVAAQELLTSANLALSLSPVLTQSAIELLLRWGDDRQRARFLPHLITGAWTGTMNLTEPEAGSDLGAVRTTAERRGDGQWEVTGTKIFITWGEHDLADNIVHLVIARTPGAPSGTKGLSLFAVPKHRVGEDGTIGERNGVRCLSIEHKLGIHASPTCVLDFAGAVGELVGEERQGMTAMFTMMNAARLSIGLQGVATSERAYQQALGFAHQRVQGRVPDAAPGERCHIIEHPDVRRMLLWIASSTKAQRLLAYTAGAARDLAEHHPDARRRRSAQARSDLLTPIVKAWCTDEGVCNTSLALQVHGGMGYVEETGIAQRYRDCRIAPIYEGTNGIQAIDLVVRKVGRDQGRAMFDLLEEASQLATATREHPLLGELSSGLADGVESLGSATKWVVGALASEPTDVLAGASPYLQLAGTVIGGYLLAKQAASPASAATPAAISHANFFAVERLSVAPWLLRPITAGAGRLKIV